MTGRAFTAGNCTRVGDAHSTSKQLMSHLLGENDPSLLFQFPSTGWGWGNEINLMYRKNTVYLAECPCFLKEPWEKEKDGNWRDIRNRKQETWRAAAHKLFPVSAGDEGKWRRIPLDVRNFSSLWGFNDIGNVGQKNISSSVGFYKTETTKWGKRRWLHED